MAEDVRILVMAPGQPLRDVRVTEPLMQIGGYATELPSWTVSVRELGVSCIGREFDPSENAPDNFVAYSAYSSADKIRGTVIFTASNEEGETIDLTDKQVAEVSKIVGRLERCPAITTERPKDEFHVVTLEDEDPKIGDHVTVDLRVAQRSCPACETEIPAIPLECPICGHEADVQDAAE